MGRDCTIEESQKPFKGWLTEKAPQGWLAPQGLRSKEADFAFSKNQRAKITSPISEE
jgi:hypothetical protein